MVTYKSFIMDLKPAIDDHSIHPKMYIFSDS